MNENLEDLKKRIRYLSQFLTDEREKKIDQVLENRTRRVTVCLEDLYQSQNTSAVLRSCEAFGVQDVHVIENEHKFEIRRGVSMRADKWLSINRYNDSAPPKTKSNTFRCLDGLKRAGYRIVTASPDPRGVCISAVSVDEKLALVFGSEKSGLSDEALEMSDEMMRVPMVGFVESFNVSVSVALSLYEIVARMKEVSKYELSTEEKLLFKYEWMLKSVNEGEKLMSRYFE